MRPAPYLVSLGLIACAGDGDPPSTSITVLSVTPENAAADVALDSAITLELSEAPPAGFAVELAAGGEAIEHALVVDGTTVTITPKDPMWIASDYTLDIGMLEFSSSFATRDGAWKNLALHAQPMTTAAPLGGGAAPSIATLPDGTVLAGWEGGAAIYDSKFTPASGGLAAPNRLAISGGDPDGVDIAAASPTRAVAAHAKFVGTYPNIDVRTYDGTQWSAPATVGPYLVGTVRYDQFLSGTAATEQSFAVLWHRGDFDTDQFDLYASIQTNGTWSAPFLVEKLPGAVYGAEIVDDGKGGYVVAWIQNSVDKLSTAVYVATLSSTGVVGQPQLLDDGTGKTYSLTAVRGGDTTWIGWAHRAGTTGMRYVARPFVNGTLGAAKQIDVDASSAYGEWVRLAANARGGVLLAYTRYGGVYAATATNGAWSASVELDPIPATNAEAGRPALALDERGNATAMWTRVPSTGRRVSVVARARNGMWTQPMPLDEGTGSTYVWTAGVDTAGRVTTLWTQYDGTSYTVWGAHLQ
jgi:hypothetical protein